MADPDIDDPYVREVLGLYVLGALKGDERDRVERHLAQCADCCIEADALGAAVEPLALVSSPHLRHVMAEFVGVPVEEPRTDGRKIDSGPD